MTRAPSHPHVEQVNTPVIRRAIWLTEEYAIIDFMSVCRIHKNEVITAPQREIAIIRGPHFSRIVECIIPTRKSP